MSAEDDVDGILLALDIGAQQLMLDLGESPEAMRGAMVVAAAVISLAEHFRSRDFDVSEHTRHASTNIAVLALMAQLSQRIHDVRSGI